MYDPLSQCIRNFGLPPRRISLWDRFTYFRLTKPNWLVENPSDLLNVQYDCLLELLRHGIVVWGHIVQANYQMFENGEDDYPAEVVFSLAKNIQVNPDFIRGVSRRIAALKGTVPDDWLLVEIAEATTNEYCRFFGLGVPLVLSDGIPCFVSVVQLFRKHLPGARLCNGLVPFIVNPEYPMFGTVLPERYWPDDFRAWWLNRS